MQPGVFSLEPSCVCFLPSCTSCYPMFSVNAFSVLPSVNLPGTGFIVPVESRSARKSRLRRYRISAALRLSSVSLSGDLGSESPMTFNATINNSLPGTCMIDCQATSQFIDLNFALSLNLNLDLKPKPEDLIVVDGRRSAAGQITHSCTLKLTVDQHEEVITFQVTKLAS